MVRWSPLTHSENMKGPLPALTGPLPRFAAPIFCTAAGDNIMPARSVRFANRGANGFLRLNCTCEASMACTDCTVVSSLARGDVGADNIRLILNTTASALNGVPSSNFTSVRRVNTSLVWSEEVYDHEVAKSGRTALCSSTLTRVS